MNREDMINELIARDIEDIREQINDDDHFFIDAVLRGESGWKQYAYLTDEEIEIEYKDRIESE